MTGDEWADTGRDVEQHVLPLLRRHRVRYVQVARAQLLTTKAGDGIVVLDDSRHPERVHLAGAYRLLDELTAAGTIPQSGGDRRCSLRAKGAVLDPVIAALTDGQPYRHVVGFEADELTRAYGTPRRKGDAAHNTATRTGQYPLIDWRWNRQDCIDYIASVTGGVLWEKSACSYCPFALANREGRTRVLQRMAAEPAAAIEPLMLEHRAIALNPAQGLIGGRRLIDLLLAEQLHHVVELFTTAREEQEHVVYEVRRILRSSEENPDKLGKVARSRRILDRGSATQMRRALHRLARQRGAQLDRSDTITRAWLHRRGETLPSYEHFLVAAPAGAVAKQDANFETWWTQTTGQTAGQPDQSAVPPLTQRAS
ncbi:hypothetical protein [Kineococcus sp. SYSU DK005]|uniref:hypothetical protein n=1 Tax=Kineococcus sp. SYSU DK005 TaxID=3383126 RepID=UPI003D7E8E85